MQSEVVQEMMRRERQTLGAPSPLALVASAPRPTTAVDLLWHERDTARFGDLERVVVPIAGVLEPACAPHIQRELEHRWLVHGTSPWGPVSSVAVELGHGPGGQHLVLLLTGTDSEAAGQAETMRVARDVRMAVRAARRLGAAPVSVDLDDRAA